MSREGLFTTRRGAAKPIYQFHPLFRRFLLEGPAARMPAERTAALERRAAMLLGREGESELAAELLIRNGDWTELVDIVLERARSLLGQGRHRLLLDWTSALPAAVREGNAWVSYWHGAALLPDDAFRAYELFHSAYLDFRERDDAHGMYVTWIGVAESLFSRHDEMRPVRFWIAELDTLRKRHPRYPDLETRVKIGILATNILMIAYPDHPDLPAWLGRAEKAYRFLPLKELRCFISLPLGWNYAARGRFDRLHLLAGQIEPLVASPRLSRLARLQGTSCLMLSAMHRGDRRAAYRVVEAALSLAESSGIGFAQQNVYSHACLTYLIWGDVERAESMVRAFAETIEPCQRISSSHSHWQEGWLAAVRHRFALAKEHLTESHDIVCDLGTPFFELLATGGLAQICTELGEFDDAWRWLCRTRALMATQRYENALVYYGNCLEAYWHLRQGKIDAALGPLERFLTVARKRNWLAYAMWEPRMQAALCELALRHDIEVDHARRVIRTYALTPPDPLAVPPTWPYALRIGVLGEFRVRVQETPLDIAGKAAARPLELLRCLVVLGARQVPQTRLIERLWPDSEGDAGTRAFHTTLHRLRRLLDNDELLALKNGQLSLDERHVEIDLWALDTALDSLERAVLDASSTGGAAEHFDAVTALYHAPLLRDHEPVWLIDRRDALQRRVLRVALAFGARAAELGESGRAVAAHEFALEIDTRHEPAYRALMRLHLRHGRFAEAARIYERCRGVLSRTLGVLPSAETVRLQAKIRRAADTTDCVADEAVGESLR